MRTTTTLLSVSAIVFSCFGQSFAQQFAGQFIPNSLPVVTGGNVSFFNVFDALGGRTTLINYYSTPNGKPIDPLKVRRAIIPLHGLNRDGWSYFDHTRAKIPLATAKNSQITEDSVAIFSPVFANEADANKAYPVVGGKPTTNALVWPGLFWFSGATNTLPANQTSVSSYEALDQVIQWFANPVNFPNMKQIVLAGHSAGAQMSQRYAVVGRPLHLTVSVSYYVGNPNSFAWLNSSRPFSTANCTTYNQWSGGLANYGTGRYTYNAALLSSPALLRTNYELKTIAYARGLSDTGDNSQGDCAPYSQGSNRGVRFLNFMKYFPPNSLSSVDYVPNVAHSDTAMFGSEAGVARLFLDNWDGSGRRAPDFGTRQVPGDNPHPAAQGNWTSINLL